MKAGKGYVIIACIIIVSMLGCQHRNGEEQATGATEWSADTITIDEESNLNSKIETAVVEMKPYAAVVQTTGVISPIPTQYAEIASPLPGRVTKSHIKIGQTVRQGSALFDIASSEYSEIAKNYIQSKSNMQQAERALKRTKDLYDNHVASSKELEEAQNEYNLAKEEYNHALSVTKEYQLNTEKMEVGQAMTVRSPISGKVLKNETVIGEYMKEDTEAKVIVADLGKVWIKANLSETEAPLASELKKVEIRTVASHDSVMEGTIVYVGGMLDPETRTLQTIIECDNREERLMPNMYADLTMYTDDNEHIIIPKESVLQSSEGRYVLKKVGERRYLKTYVKVQSADDKQLIVLDGLKAGDEIISKGAFYLSRLAGR